MSQSFNDHPFSAPLDELTTDELDKRFNDIMTRFNTARRLNMPADVLHQLDLLLVSVENERERRTRVDEKPNGVILDTDPIVVPTFKGF
jgi:hypothetical protein